MVPTLRHVLVIGVDGVRFDLLGPEVTPVIWGFGSLGFLGAVPVDETTPTWSGPCWATIVTGCDAGGHGGREPEVATAWAAAAGPGIQPGGPALITSQAQVAPLVLGALGKWR
jgi:Type I phosphodiesterase / nucleotide pyrophosphatase